MRPSRVSDSRKVRQRQSQLEEAKRLTQELVELLDRRSDLHGVHYLTIEREWVGAVYFDDSRGPLFQYRRKP
jgi:hypothetical protein